MKNQEHFFSFGWTTLAFWRLLTLNTWNECTFFSLTLLVLKLRRICFYLGCLPARKVSEPVETPIGRRTF